MSENGWSDYHYNKENVVILVQL